MKLPAMRIGDFKSASFVRKYPDSIYLKAKIGIIILLHTAQYANLPLGIGAVLEIICGVYAVCVLLDWMRRRLFRPLLCSKWFSEIDTGSAAFF